MKKLILLLLIVGVFSCCKEKTTWTTLVVENATPKEVIVWLTIGVPYRGYVSNVQGIFGITDEGLVGTFHLKSGESRSYTSQTGFSGNLSFNTPPQNCPDDRTKYPLGISFFEFTINNWMQPEPGPQESVDITCVAGINCSIECKLSGLTWNAGPVFPDVKFIANNSWGKNTGLPGVYPVGCDHCTWIGDPGRCDINPVPYEKTNGNDICTVQRPATNVGDKGKIIVIYRGEGFIQ